MAVSTPSDLASAAGEKIATVLQVLGPSHDTQVVLVRLTDRKAKRRQRVATRAR
jgi:hypothetical protein